MIYLPLIRNDDFYKYIITSPWQLRNNLQISQCLNQSSRTKASLINTTGQISHVINGVHPNKLVRSWCQNLHPDYSDDQNYVEAIVWGLANFYQAVDHLLQSPSHKPIMTGEGWYSRQSHFGIGYAHLTYVFHFADFI